jgi:hypothetical protein
MKNFNEADYLSLYPDVAEAVKAGEFKGGYEHYLLYGKAEGRAPNRQDYRENNHQTKRSTLCRHSNIWSYIGQNFNNKDFKVLEIGSRSVISDSLWKRVIPSCTYTGFDVLPGKNVDVVGDAHRLSEYFPNQKFDLIISFAVFEHLAMPFLVSQEISKLLNDGGITIHETHFSYSEHELPWHFFQFNSNALEVLFCQELGFELIDSGLDNPIDGYFSNDADSYLAGKEVQKLFCHSSIIAKMNKNKSSSKFEWAQVTDRLSKVSMYPSHDKD